MNDAIRHQDLGVRNVRVYVDHLDNEDGRVWAVDCRPEAGLRRRYVRATQVVLRGVLVATFRREGRRQPRAWLDVFGRVRVMTHRSGIVLVTIRNR